jgi:hypothetical protein
MIVGSPRTGYPQKGNQPLNLLKVGGRPRPFFISIQGLFLGYLYVGICIGMGNYLLKHFLSEKEAK